MQYYVSSQNQQYGPYPAKVLSNWIALGRVSPDAMISDGGPWITVRQFMLNQARAMATSSGTDELEVIESIAPSTTSGPSAAGASTTAAASATATGQQKNSVAAPQDDIPVERDRIVIIGRRQSGKTIYLASLYAKLWKSLDGLTAKAVSGEVHRHLMGVHQSLVKGRWPAATLATFQIELEIEHKSHKRLMVTLDFAGELFRKAFVEENSEFPGVAELTDHIDRAAAVILLVDPSVVTGMDHEAAMDDDFGLVQAVQRIRNWPGGDDVPVVLALTKMDQYQHLLDRFGGSTGFVRHHFPALVRMMKKIPIFQMSAVQTRQGPDGKAIPQEDSQSVNIEMPLRYCLDLVDGKKEIAECEEMETQKAAYERRQEEDERKREQRQNRILIGALVAILVGGAVIVVLILMGK